MILNKDIANINLLVYANSQNNDIIFQLLNSGKFSNQFWNGTNLNKFNSMG